jgi:uncharacterized membrane protein YphA (DoxX/SURF4 family)
MSAVLVIARILFSLLFLSSGINHLTKVEAMTGYAKYKKLPAAKLGVILSGLVMIVGSVFIILGYYVDLAGLMLAAFTLVAGIIFHNFWAEKDATAKMNETVAFFKNISLTGAGIIIYAYAHFIATLNTSPLSQAPGASAGFLKGFGWVISKGHLYLWK